MAINVDLAAVNNALSQPALLREAEAASVVWARVKGYASWPAQILTKGAAERLLANVPKKKGYDVPVMFFGSKELAMVTQADVASLAAGLKQKFINKGKSTKTFQLALAEVCEFLAQDGRRNAPSNWWCSAPDPGAASRPPIMMPLLPPAAPTSRVGVSEQPHFDAAGPPLPLKKRKFDLPSAPPAHAATHAASYEQAVKKLKQEAYSQSAAFKSDLPAEIRRLAGITVPKKFVNGPPNGTHVNGHLPLGPGSAAAGPLNSRSMPPRSAAPPPSSSHLPGLQGLAGASGLSNAVCIATGKVLNKAKLFTGEQPVGGMTTYPTSSAAAPSQRPQLLQRRAEASSGPPHLKLPASPTAAAADSGAPGATTMRSSTTPGGSGHPQRRLPGQLGIMVPPIRTVAAIVGDSSEELTPTPGTPGVVQIYADLHVRPKPPPPAAAAAAGALAAWQQAQSSDEHWPACSEDAVAAFSWPDLPDDVQSARRATFALPPAWLADRPPRYQPLRMNMWASRRQRPKRMNKDDISVCCCKPPATPLDASAERTGCGEDCLNRRLNTHCDPKSCPCGEHCSNLPFHLRKMPKLDVFKTPDRGHGVRAGEFLPRGSFIVEYTGEVIDQDELEARMLDAQHSGEGHFYIMGLTKGLYLDARRKGNMARLLNSSCDPNCETQKWHDAATGETRIGIFTLRDVQPGEELCYDYMFEHYGLGSQASEFKCRCGAKNCRGTMDVNPEKKRDFGRRLEVFWDGDGVYYRGTIVDFNAKSRMHKIMYDDGEREPVLLDEVPHRWLDSDASHNSDPLGDEESPSDKAAAAGDVSSAAPPAPAAAAQPPSHRGAPQQPEAPAAPVMEVYKGSPGGSKPPRQHAASSSAALAMNNGPSAPMQPKVEDTKPAAAPAPAAPAPAPVPAAPAAAPAGRAARPGMAARQEEKHGGGNHGASSSKAISMEEEAVAALSGMRHAVVGGGGNAPAAAAAANTAAGHMHVLQQAAVRHSQSHQQYQQRMHAGNGYAGHAASKHESPPGTTHHPAYGNSYGQQYQQRRPAPAFSSVYNHPLLKPEALLGFSLPTCNLPLFAPASNNNSSNSSATTVKGTAAAQRQHVNGGSAGHPRLPPAGRPNSALQHLLAAMAPAGAGGAKAHSVGNVLNMFAGQHQQQLAGARGGGPKVSSTGPGAMYLDWLNSPLLQQAQQTSPGGTCLLFKK